MKLTELVYECVKDSVNLPRQTLAYTDFVNSVAGNESVGTQWSMQLSGVFNALNLGLARLVTYNRIPFSQKMVHFDLSWEVKVTYSDSSTENLVVITPYSRTKPDLETVTAYMSDGLIPFKLSDYESASIVRCLGSSNQVTFDDGAVVNVVHTMWDGDYVRLGFRTLNLDKRIVLQEPIQYDMALIEYKKTIPHFTENDFIEIPDTGIDSNIDLTALYGISDTMCAFLKEFVAAQLTEYMQPEIANNHNTRAEQYFDSLPIARTSFFQNRIVNVQKGWF